MIAVTTAVAVMLYLDRVCLSILSEQIKPLLGDTPDEQKSRFADLTAAFFWSYALFQLPAGWLGDRFGPRYVLAAYLFLWSACTGMMGFTNGFLTLFALRLGCGVFEAGAYPLAAGIVRTWVPPTVRGFASGCVAVGGRFGGVIAPVLTVALMTAGTDGWRMPFFVYGLIGMAGAIPFILWYRNRPGEHPAVNAAEAELIGSAPQLARLGPPPIGAFVRSRALWLSSLVQFLANFAWVFIITLFPAYLKEVFDTPAGTRAVYQSLPLAAGIVGMLLGGWLSDRAVRRFGRRWGRGLPVVGSRLLVGAAYLGCLVVRDPLAVTLMMCVVAFATDMGTAPVWAWAQDVGGRHVGGVIGWANMWGNFGAAVAPIAFDRIRLGFPDSPAVGWGVAFGVCAAVQVIAAVAALGLDARTPIDRPPAAG
jgi:ACS family glucarate transporter-like MFS transporter